MSNDLNLINLLRKVPGHADHCEGSCGGKGEDADDDDNAEIETK